MKEFVLQLNTDTSSSFMVGAAMSHLNLVMIHAVWGEARPGLCCFPSPEKQFVSVPASQGLLTTRFSPQIPICLD